MKNFNLCSVTKGTCNKLNISILGTTTESTEQFFANDFLHKLFLKFKGLF